MSNQHWIVLPSIFAEFQPHRLVQVTEIDYTNFWFRPGVRGYLDVEYESHDPDVRPGKIERDYVPRAWMAPTAVQAIDNYLLLFMKPRLERIIAEGDVLNVLQKHQKELAQWEWLKQLLLSHQSQQTPN